MEDKEYYIATKDKKGKYVIYETLFYKFSEIEFLNLIKICIIEARSKKMGRKLLEIYKDSNQDRETIVTQRLNLIGINNEKPKTTKRPKTK